MVTVDLGLNYNDIPQVALASAFDTILEEISSQLRTLFLVIVCIETIFLGVSFGRRLEIGLAGTLAGHGRSIRIVITRLLAGRA